MGKSKRDQFCMARLKDDLDMDHNEFIARLQALTDLCDQCRATQTKECRMLTKNLAHHFASVCDKTHRVLAVWYASEDIIPAIGISGVSLGTEPESQSEEFEHFLEYLFVFAIEFGGRVVIEDHKISLSPKMITVYMYESHGDMFGYLPKTAVEKEIFSDKNDIAVAGEYSGLSA